MESLIDAIATNDFDLVQDMLSQGVSPNLVDDNSGESVLAMAAGQGHVAIVEALLEAGADANSLDTTVWPLTAAAGRGHVDVVEALLQSDAEINSLDEDGVSAISAAAAGGHSDIVELLLEAGADARMKDRYGERAIIKAGRNGHPAVVGVLAPYSTRQDQKKAIALIEKARRQPINDAALAFIDAAREGDIEAVEAYLKEGGDVNSTDDEGNCALSEAAGDGALDIVSLLIDHGADVNCENSCAAVPLIHAAAGGYSSTFDVLYPITRKKYQEQAKKIKEEMIDGELWRYVRPDIDEMFDRQQVSADKLEEVFAAATYSTLGGGSPDDVSHLIEHEGVPENVIQRDGTTLLMEAAESAYHELVERLVSIYKVDVDVTNVFGKCALRFAVEAVRRDKNTGQPIYDYLYRVTNSALRLRVEKVKKRVLTPYLRSGGPNY
ncbi:MAG: ankyrin repeat domain-containing protein [Pirellulales bacterium]